MVSMDLFYNYYNSGIIKEMGKFTKDKRVTKDAQYSKNVPQDIYYRKAKEQCYRARSAYKLLQIQQIYHIFDGVQRVIDLCGAPGSWSQVCRKKLGQMGYFGPNDQIEGQRIVSVDLQDTAPIDHVFHITGDITKEQTLKRILEAFKGQKCQLVICDGAPDITGFHDMDQYIQSQLLVAALNITTKLLKKGGNFVAKIFKGSEYGLLYSQFKYFFREIHIVKPDSSRESSVEHFLVGLRFHGGEDNMDLLELSTFDSNKIRFEDGSKEEKVFKFVTCGDLSPFDAKQESLVKQQNGKSEQKTEQLTQ